MTERTLSQAPAGDGFDDSGIEQDVAGFDDTGIEQDVIVLAQADSSADGDAASSTPLNLVQVDEEIEEAAQAQAAIDELPVTEIEVGALAAGERRSVDVPPNSIVSLAAPVYDPATATYSVGENSDLVVVLPNGAVLFLVGFFLPSEAPPFLRVLGGPATSASELLERAEAAPDVDQDGGPQEIQTVIGVISGGAQFRAYDQGDIGDGLEPAGPLGPTELVDAPPEPAIETPLDDSPGDDGNGGDEPDDEGPKVELRADIEASIGEQSGPAFNPVTTPLLPLDSVALQPIEVDRTGLTYKEWLEQTPSFRELSDAEINSVDERNLTLDVQREVFVRFINETSYSVDSLFVHEIAADGSIVNARVVFDGNNLPADTFNELKSLEPGTEVSLGNYDAGTKLAFIVLNDGFRENDFADLQGGRFEVRNPETGQIAKITDFHDTSVPDSNPLIVHIADNGTETVLNGQRFFSGDASQNTPNNNRLNPAGLGAFVSGWDDAEGMLLLGFEDGVGRFRDNSFTDLIFGVRFGSPLEPTLVVADAGAGLGAVITDSDSADMAAATITLAGLAGDRLVLDPDALSGTGITATQVSDSEIELNGLSSSENYEAAINAATVEIDLDDVVFGTRDISVTVEDPEGNTGNADTTFTIDDNLVVGTDGPDNLLGTDSEIGQPGDVISARDGADTVTSLSGDDFVDGGGDDDTLVLAGPGNTRPGGGTGVDQITLGPGADTVRITGLSDAADTVFVFDATEGDRLDLRELFRDSDITDATIDSFVSNSAYEDGISVQVDLDGPGSDQRPVTIAFLDQPTGVAVGADPSTYVITPDNEAAAA